MKLSREGHGVLFFGVLVGSLRHLHYYIERHTRVKWLKNTARDDEAHFLHIMTDNGVLTS